MCLAITALIAGVLYIVMRQQLAVLEKRIDQLTSVVKTLALDRPKEAEEPEDSSPPPEKKVYVSDDSESESDSSEDDDMEVECEYVNLEPSGVIIMQDAPNLLEMMSHVMIRTEGPPVEEFDMDVPNVEEYKKEESKQIVLEGAYESLTLKELKDKVATMGGPVLKTRKALLEFLEKKIE